MKNNKPLKIQYISPSLNQLQKILFINVLMQLFWLFHKHQKFLS